MRHSFDSSVHGRSDVRIGDSHFSLSDIPLYDELRIVTPNLAVGRWATDWRDNELLIPVIEDFKRYIPIPVSADESLLYKIYRAFDLGGLRLPRELGLSFLEVEEDEETGNTRIGLTYLLKKIS
jgi:hypothetical protein